MSTVKTRLSATVSANVAKLLEDFVRGTDITKSSIIESALQNYIEDKLDRDAKKLASLEFDDLPSEDDWLKIQLETDK